MSYAYFNEFLKPVLFLQRYNKMYSIIALLLYLEMIANLRVKLGTIQYEHTSIMKLRV